MNFDKDDFDSHSLPLKLIEAIQNPEQWSDVLDTIMAMTGAKGAIITLRDKENCQIVNDVNLEQKFHSPLIRGFSTEAIVHYLTNLRTIDPWAEFQRSHYPHRPTQMSKVCPQASFEDQRFFDWLRDVGFRDTIVFELDRMSGYWTALNLFLEEPDAPETAHALDFCNQHFELIRNAWVASQNLSKSQQSSNALLERATGADTPVCIVGPNGQLHHCNDLFRDVIATDAIRLSGTTKKLSFAHGVSVFGLESWEQHGFLKHDTESDPILLLASPIDPDPMFAEKRERLWLITCNSQSQAKKNTPKLPLEFATLTRQERDLYTAIAAGHSVAKAGEEIKLKRSRTFEVWASVKEKLGITNAHQLRD